MAKEVCGSEKCPIVNRTICQDKEKTVSGFENPGVNVFCNPK
jgi:hypothetical protein